MSDDARLGPDRPLAILYALAAASAGLVAAAPLAGLPCEACTGGLLSLAMPWIGIAFYATLSLLSVRFRSSRILAMAPGFYVLVHAALVTEMTLNRRLCPGCLAAAVFAIAAAITQLKRNVADRPAFPIALILGVAGGFISPFERVDDLVTRTFWPARMLEAAPKWVDRNEMARCEHAAPLRLLIFEKDCKS